MMHSSSSVGETRRQSSDVSCGVSDNDVADFGQLPRRLDSGRVGVPPDPPQCVWSELSIESAAANLEGAYEEIWGRNVTVEEEDEINADESAHTYRLPQGEEVGCDEYEKGIVRAATWCINRLAFSLEGPETGKGSDLVRKESLASETLLFEDESIHAPLFSREPSAILPSNHSYMDEPIDGANSTAAVTAEASNSEKIDEDVITPPIERDVPQTNTVHQSSPVSAAMDEIQQDLGKVNAALHETWTKAKHLVQPIVEVANAGAHAAVPHRFPGDGAVSEGSLAVEAYTSPSGSERENQSCVPQMLSSKSTSPSTAANGAALDSLPETGSEAMPLSPGEEHKGASSDPLLAAWRPLPPKDECDGEVVRKSSPSTKMQSLRSFRSAEPFLGMSKRLSQSAMGVGSQLQTQAAKLKLRERSAHLVEEVQKEETIRKTVAKGAEFALSLAPTQSSLKEAGGLVAKNVVQAVESVIMKSDDCCDDAELMSHLTAGAYA